MTAERFHQAYADRYADAGQVRLVRPDDTGRIRPDGLHDTDAMELRVFANAASRQIVLVARLDNLGKGASGAAVQNLGLMLGLAA